MSKVKSKYPFATVAMYGPDDKITTKVVVAVFTAEGKEPILKRWVSSTITTDKNIQNQIKTFMVEYKVKDVVLTEGNIGCPHEEGKDFPIGEDCPFCPFWAGKQGSGRK